VAVQPFHCITAAISEASARGYNIRQSRDSFKPLAYLAEGTDWRRMHNCCDLPTPTGPIILLHSALSLSDLPRLPKFIPCRGVILRKGDKKWLPRPNLEVQVSSRFRASKDFALALGCNPTPDTMGNSVASEGCSCSSMFGMHRCLNSSIRCVQFT
jgi:hypothetical protein